MNNEIIVPELNEETIESMIYEIRGVKVMLDFELAKIYGYTTTRFNEQVNRNAERFDNDFRFQLKIDEYKYILMSQKAISSHGGTRKLPYAFTEQGIYMLMTVLKGELAIKQSKAIIRLFKQMKDYIIENNSPKAIDNIISLTNQVKENTNDIKNIKNDLKIVMDNFIEPNKNKHFLILDGCRLEADLAYQEIYRQAKYSIYIIDDYIDIKTLQLLKVCNQNIDIIIFSDNKAKNSLNKAFINDFIKDTSFNITFKKNNNRFHDRYVIIDYKTCNEKLYHCGASSKDSGSRINTINIIEDVLLYNNLIDDILNNQNYNF